LPQFTAVASQLQTFESVGVFFVGKVPPGGDPLPRLSPFAAALPSAGPEANGPGLLLGLFGQDVRPTHAFVVNLDYAHDVKATIYGPREMDVFNAATRRWSRTSGGHFEVDLPPGGGILVRARKQP
jgi:hypothetical protein